MRNRLLARHLCALHRTAPASEVTNDGDGIESECGQTHGEKALLPKITFKPFRRPVVQVIRADVGVLASRDAECEAAKIRYGGDEDAIRLQHFADPNHKIIRVGHMLQRGPHGDYVKLAASVV